MTDLAQLVQGTEEWRLARCGSLGASDLHKALSRIKSGWGAGRANIMADLLCERMTGEPTENYQSADMLRGTEREPLAREAYCWLRGVEVVQVGLITHPRIIGTHASPDGLVGEDGVLEIKCPNKATHLATLEGAGIGREYTLQAQWQLACTGRKWVDWCSFHPAFPLDMQLYVQRIERDEKAIAETEGMVEEFLAELDAKLSALRARYLRKEAA